MPILSAKRQITLPKALCDRLKIAPGDQLSILERDGRISILKQRTGASKGVLAHLGIDRDVEDAASREDAMSKTQGHG